MTARALPPLSLYVHLPWCVRKCPYCDFNSHQRPASLPDDAYVGALLADLDQDLGQVQGRAIESIFFGGGTPSLFPAPAIARILDGVRSRLALVPDCEITLETNPGTAEFDRFEGYLAAGVNRFSFGVQSFDDSKLKRLGRIHGGDEARAAFAMARAAGVNNINLDLMYGLPAQTPQQALDDIESALALAPEHLSHYQLTLEPQTVFARFPPQDLPDEDALESTLELCQARLALAGFDQYEVSAYALPGRRSRHNLNYWQYGDYLGIGAGAHGKWTDAHNGGIHRQSKQRTPTLYLQCAGTSASLVDVRKITPSDLPFEFMLNALRLRAGFDDQIFAERTGLALAVDPGFQRALREGLIEQQHGHSRATELGYRYLNDTLNRFLPEGESPR